MSCRILVEYSERNQDIHTQVISMNQSSIPTPAILKRAVNRMATKMKETAHPTIYTIARAEPRSSSEKGGVEVMIEHRLSRWEALLGQDPPPNGRCVHISAIKTQGRYAYRAHTPRIMRAAIHVTYQGTVDNLSRPRVMS
jgi:hypothetical protein